MIAFLAITLVCAVAALHVRRRHILERPALGVFDSSDLWLVAIALHCYARRDPTVRGTARRRPFAGQLLVLGNPAT